MEKKMEGIILEERSDIGGNYLVAIGCDEGGYQEKMLKNSKIEGLLPVGGQDFNGRHELWFAIGKMQPLSIKFKQKTPGTAEITELIKQIEELAVKLQEYLLEPKEIGLTLSWIFEGEGGKYLFLYLPGYIKERQTGICRLLEELMEYVDYENHRAVSFLYLLHAKSRQQAGEEFALYHLCDEILKAEQEQEQEREQDDFFAEFERMEEEKKEEENGEGKKSRIRKIIRPRGNLGERKEEETERKGSLGGMDMGIGSRGSAEKKNIAGERKIKKGKFQGLLNKFASFIKEEQEDFALEDRKEEIRVLQEEEYIKKVKNVTGQGYDLKTGECADTVLLTGGELTQTVLLGSDSQISLEEEQYYLKPEGEQARIYLSVTPFCIGKEETCNYVLREPVISRHHAKILKERGRYLLVDTNSLNGTYLNGRKLAAYAEAEIKSGDRIDFADLSFLLECDKNRNNY